MPRDPPVMSAALPASEIMIPPSMIRKSILVLYARRRAKPGLVAFGPQFPLTQSLRLACGYPACVPRGANEVAEQPLRQRLPCHPLRMPLHTRYPVRVSRPLDPLHNPIGRVACDREVAAWLLNRLVVRTVNHRLGPLSQSCQSAAGLKARFMDGVLDRFREQVFAPVSDCRSGLAAQVLDEGAAKIDIQDLATVTDCQHRLFVGKSKFQNGTVGLVPRHVWGVRKSFVRTSILGRVHVCRATRQNEPV